MKKNPMLDEDFLKKLSEFKHQFVWAKIISLDFNEYPIEEITGKVTSGTIPVDGQSAVRRTCNLTMVAEDVNINDYYWSLKTKFKVEIGLENYIDSSYPDIIWFKQGTFLISSFSCSLTTNNYTINIQGKDKMSLLNGDFGGVIPSSWDFGTINETLKDGSIKNTQIPIKDIVLQAVHEYAQEPWQNIIVNDLDDYGIELLEYQGTTPFYYLINAQASGDNDSREVAQMVFNPDLEVYVELVDWYNNSPKFIKWAESPIKISEIENIQETGLLAQAGAVDPPTYSYEKLLEQLDPSGAVTETKNYYRARVRLKDSDTVYTVAKIERDNGLQVCGYRICDIVYPYDLIASPGETVTSVLDKLVQMLGNFEYFYDVDGKFIFQRKRVFLDVTYNNIIGEHDINREIWVEDKMFNSKYSYVFDENTLISSIQNTPNIGEIKNDYSLWGSRKSGDKEFPIHMRYAIDHKPYWYKTFDGKVYCTEKGWKKYLEANNGEVDINLGKTASAFGGNPRILHMRDDYPLGLDESWFKLSDWLFMYSLARMKADGRDVSLITSNDEIKEIVDEHGHPIYYPEEDVQMSFGSKTLLNNHYYQELKDITGVFPIDPKSRYASYKDTYQISIFDTQVLLDNETGEEKTYIVSLEHGYRSCSHTYVQLENRTTRTIWVYDPRLTGKEQAESGDILTDDIINTVINELEEKDNANIVDWREIIYQMANDYRRHYHDDDFLITLRDNNKWAPTEYVYPAGYTGYEKYYMDFEMNLSQGVVAYWRELYNPEAINDEGVVTVGRYIVAEGGKTKFVQDNSYSYWVEKEEGYKKGDFVRFQEEGSEIVNVYISIANNNKDIPGAIINNRASKWSISNGDFIYNSDGWNINILNNPEILNFWFDFLDAGDGNTINRYGVNVIGQRTKAANDSTIKSIYFRETPNVIFDFGDEDIQKKWLKPGYSHLRIPNIYKGIFTISTRGKNAMDVIEDYLYQYVYPINSISFNSVPIYYLAPNTLIYLNDKQTGAVGEYILQRYSIQLGLNSQMNISAVETAKRIY